MRLQVELAESWGVDSSAWDRAWSSLSGGEAQRISLSLAVGIPGAEILLLDGMPPSLTPSPY